MGQKKRLGTNFEKKIVGEALQKNIPAKLQPLSGQLKESPGDIEFEEFLGECKVRSAVLNSTGQRFIRLDTEWLEKIDKQAKRSGKRFGVVFLKMKEARSSYTIMRTADFLEMINNPCQPIRQDV